MGSVNAPDNSQYPTLSLNLENRFKNGIICYTSLPCYTHPNNNYSNPSLNSSGMTTSAFTANGTSTYYTVCNIGSVYNNDNIETSVKMTGQNRFKYYSTPSYTAIPCYSHFNNNYLHPSPDSSGKCTSIIGSYNYYLIILIYNM